MKIIRIINGVYGYRPKDGGYIEPKRAGDPPFAVDDEEAARLVNLKVAAYVDDEESAVSKLGVATPETEDKDAKTSDNTTGKKNTPEGEITPPNRPTYNTDMKAAELREIMTEFQLPYKVGMTKADMVSALDNYFADEVDDEESADDMPDLGAEDSIV